MVEGHASGERPADRRDCLAARVLELCRPAAPRRPEAFGDGAERRVVLERPALPADPRLHTGGGGRDLEDCLAWARPPAGDCVVGDEALCVKSPGLISQPLPPCGAEPAAR